VTLKDATCIIICRFSFLLVFTIYECQFEKNTWSVLPNIFFKLALVYWMLYCGSYELPFACFTVHEILGLKINLDPAIRLVIDIAFIANCLSFSVSIQFFAKNLFPCL
jgi:hypothetical protein